MSEQPVFWLGGKPGDKNAKTRARPEAERYESAIRDACESCGFELDEYVAAQGGYGGWLAHLERDGRRFRVFWSGKDRRLTYDAALAHGGWEPLSTAEMPDDGLPGFVAAVKSLLTADSSDSQDIHSQDIHSQDI